MTCSSSPVVHRHVSTGALKGQTPPDIHPTQVFNSSDQSEQVSSMTSPQIYSVEKRFCLLFVQFETQGPITARLSVRSTNQRSHSWQRIYFEFVEFRRIKELKQLQPPWVWIHLTKWRKKTTAGFCFKSLMDLSLHVKTLLQYKKHSQCRSGSGSRSRSWSLACPRWTQFGGGPSQRRGGQASVDGRPPGR